MNVRRHEREHAVRGEHELIQDRGTLVLILVTMVLQVLNPFLVLVFIPLFDLVIYRLISKCGVNFS